MEAQGPQLVPRLPSPPTQAFRSGTRARALASNERWEGSELSIDHHLASCLPAFSRWGCRAECLGILDDELGTQCTDFDDFDNTLTSSFDCIKTTTLLPHAPWLRPPRLLRPRHPAAPPRLLVPPPPPTPLSPPPTSRTNVHLRLRQLECTENVPHVAALR